MKLNIKIHIPRVILLFLSFTFYTLRAGTPANDLLPAKRLFTVWQCVKSPLRMAGDNAGNIYVTNGHNYISRYDSSGNYSSKIAVSGPPLALAISGTSLYISMHNSTHIIRMDTSGTILQTFGHVLLASDMAFDKNGQLYVTDSKSRQVMVFDRKGTLLRTFGNDVLVFPTGIAIDEKNQHILITEHGGIAPADTALPVAKIHIFDKQGNWLKGYGGYGSNDGKFIRMQGLAVDPLGRIFVADSYQGIIQILGKNGDFLGQLGQFGYERDQLSQPMDVVLDQSNHLWVSSYNSDALLVFDIKGLPTALNNATSAVVPVKNDLMQNYPNPFNNGTLIPFSLGQNGFVSIHIYNCTGQKIRSVRLGNRSKGSYKGQGKAYYWDGKNDSGQLVASGLYYYELRLKNYRAVRRMLLIK